VDAGFQILDPFGVLEDRENAAQVLVQLHRDGFSLSRTHMEPVANRSLVLTGKRRRRRVLKGNQDWQISSYCLRDTRAGRLSGDEAGGSGGTE
jgi:hypothetical protein